MDVPAGKLYLGATVDPETHERSDSTVLYDSANFTTHGVIVGMTGSGKTGLGVCLLEEVLLQGIPALVIDPKGDMTNLCLTFPQLAAADFQPWIDPAAAQRDGKSIEQAAADTASLWSNGLAGWDIGSERLAALASVDTTIYTPGSTAGIPLNILGSMNAPDGVTDAETMADEIEGLASSLLGLVGIEADPLASREHILIANLINHAWTNGQSLDLGVLISQIQQPPIRKLGVIDLDTFFPPDDRMKLAMQLNGLAASPAFASWMQGEPLDIGSLLYTPDGAPRCAIVTIAHLNDEERQFVTTLVLSKMVSWMRAQPGTSELRAMVYMDEVFGFVPPTAAPPAKKPILTIFKQARAFGVGMVLSTQNPVDIDYKAISNAGTWMIGRLQTERDKARLLEGMTSAGGTVDIAAVDATISGLGKREFLLHSSKADAPAAFTTRWAMNYLAGPLTREQIGTLMTDKHAALAAASTPAATAAPAAASPTAAAPPAADELADDETPTLPPVADGRRVFYLDPAAPWAAEVGATAGGTRLEPALVARVQMLFDETKADLRHEEEFEAVFHPLTDPIDPDTIRAVDYDDRDLRTDAPEGARYVLTDARIDTKTYFTKAGTVLKEHLYRSETLTLLHNPSLKLSSRPGETEDEFRQRCERAADDKIDEEVDKLRRSLEPKVDRIKDAIRKAEDRVREAEHDAASRGNEELLSGVGEVLGGLFGGKKSGRSILGGIRRAGSKRRMKEKAQERLATAENRLTEKVDDLQELEEELADSLEDIQEVWDDNAAAIEPLEIPLEKTDISIEEVALLWIPTS